MTRTAVLYLAPGVDPARDRIVHGSTTIVAVADESAVSSVAVDLADRGARLIELCGGFSPIIRAEVAEALGTRARVSSIAYGIESLDAAARFKAAYDRGETPKEAFLLLDLNAREETAPVVATPDFHPTIIVPVRDTAHAAGKADELAADGVLLIELYGGFTTADIAKVLTAVGGRAAVGAGSFAVDAARL